jgi:hypothetical protein
MENLLGKCATKTRMATIWPIGESFLRHVTYTHEAGKFRELCYRHFERHNGVVTSADLLGMFSRHLEQLQNWFEHISVVNCCICSFSL